MKAKIICLVAVLVMLLMQGQKTNAQGFLKTDAGIISIDGIEGVMATGKFTPKVTVQNFGAMEMTVSISVKMNRTCIDRQLIVLRPYAATTVMFSETNLKNGHYDTVAQINSIADSNKGNNQMSASFTVADNCIKPFQNKDFSINRTIK